MSAFWFFLGFSVGFLLGVFLAIRTARSLRGGHQLDARPHGPVIPPSPPRRKVNRGQAVVLVEAGDWIWVSTPDLAADRRIHSSPTCPHMEDVGHFDPMSGECKNWKVERVVDEKRVALGGVPDPVQVCEHCVTLKEIHCSNCGHLLRRC